MIVYVSWYTTSQNVQQKDCVKQILITRRVEITFLITFIKLTLIKNLIATILSLKNITEILVNNLYFVETKLFFLLILSYYHVTQNSRKIIIYKKILLYKICNFFISFALIFYFIWQKVFSIFPKFPDRANDKKNERFAGIPSIREKKERDRTLLYYSMPTTFTAGSFLLHFPIFFLHPLPPVFLRRSLERRKTGAELTKTIKSDFFRADEPLRFPALFFARSDFFHILVLLVIYSRGKNSQAYLKKFQN